MQFIQGWHNTRLIVELVVNGCRIFAERDRQDVHLTTFSFEEINDLAFMGVW
jgi:hypothetical protein